jgi:hypothetical protein
MFLRILIPKTLIRKTKQHKSGSSLYREEKANGTERNKKGNDKKGIRGNEQSSKKERRWIDIKGEREKK